MHRLDKDTSGVLVLARTRMAAKALTENIAAHASPPAIAKVFLRRTTVFAITDNRVANLGHMGAQLVGTARDRDQRTP